MHVMIDVKHRHSFKRFKGQAPTQIFSKEKGVTFKILLTNEHCLKF